MKNDIQIIRPDLKDQKEEIGKIKADLWKKHLDRGGSNGWWNRRLIALKAHWIFSHRLYATLRWTCAR